jgi:hypothetical protein
LLRGDWSDFPSPPMLRRLLSFLFMALGLFILPGTPNFNRCAFLTAIFCRT